MVAGLRFRCIPLLLSPLLLLAVACADQAAAPDSGTQSTAPADAENAGIVVVDDQIVLNAKLFGAANDVGVVLAHMRRADQSAWFPFAQRLADEGYAVLTFDFRGYGASGGSEDLDQLDDDLREAVRYLREDRKKERVFIVGASMGGTAALVVAQDGNVLGVVAISAPSTFEEQDALSAVQQIDVPVLLLASEDDTAAMLSLDELLAAATGPKDSETYSGNLHGTDLFQPGSAHNDEIVERVLSFLDGLKGD